VLLESGRGGDDGVPEFGDALDDGDEEGDVEGEEDELEEFRGRQDFTV